MAAHPSRYGRSSLFQQPASVRYFQSSQTSGRNPTVAADARRTTGVRREARLREERRRPLVFDIGVPSPLFS